jgi:hypothetical protein
MNMHISGNRREPSYVPIANKSDIKRLQKYYSDCLDSNLEGFIHHPAAFPLTWRRVRRLKWKKSSASEVQPANIGLCFGSEKYIKPGTELELEITLRGEIQKFTGRVILVKNLGECFDIGVWLSTKEAAGRIRIVEQICHIEAYLKHKRHYEGPFVSPERVAQEWISRFASSFPSFG